MRKKIFLLCLLFIVGVLYNGDGNQLLNKKSTGKSKNFYRWVLSRNGLNMRTSPSLKGKIIRAIPFSCRVLVYAGKQIPAVIGGKKGNWVKVNAWNNVNTCGKANGWVFDYYLGSAEKLFALKDGKYGEYRYYESWQSDFLISITLHANGTYLILDVWEGEITARCMGRYRISGNYVIVYKPTKVIKIYKKLKFPIRFKFEVSNGLIGLLGDEVCYYKYPWQSY